MSNQKQVTERNTKAEILKAYEEILKQLEQKESQVFDPVKEKQNIENKETVKTVESLKVSNLETMLESIRTNVEKVSSELNNYNQVKTAIQIKEAELKNMFDIEVKANSLAALIKSQTELKAEFDEKMVLKKEELQKLETEQKANLSEERKRFNEEIVEFDKEAKLNHKRQEQEWKYEFDRKKKMDKDSLQDELKEMEIKAKEELQKWEDELNEKETLLEQREQKIEGLEKENETLKARIDEVIEETTQKVTDKLKTSNGFEVRYIKRDYDAKVELLENKIESLQESLTKEQKSNEILSDKLDGAYNKLESIANKTVESTSNAKVMNQFENMFKTQNNQSK